MGTSLFERKSLHILGIYRYIIKPFFPNTSTHPKIQERYETNSTIQAQNKHFYFKCGKKSELPCKTYRSYY